MRNYCTNIKLFGLKLKIELNALPIYDDRYIKTKIRTCGDKVYTNFCGLDVPQNGVEFYSHFYRFFTCIRRKILSASIF